MQSTVTHPEFAGRQIVIARAFIAQGAVDQDEIGRFAQGGNLAGRGDADQEFTAAGKEFFGQQHGKGSADGTADDAKALPCQWKGIERGMVTSPIGIDGRLPGCQQIWMS